MSERLRKMLNRLDVNDDGKVDIADAVEAYQFVDGEVRPHGWLWTLSNVCIGFLLGYFAHWITS